MNPPPTAVLAALPPGAGVAVIRLRSLGDTVLTTPALAAIKRWRPDLRLAVVVEPRFAPALRGNPDVDVLVPAPRSLHGRWRALRALRRFRPALTVSLHGGATAAWLCRASGAPLRVGFLGWRHAWAYNLLAPSKSPAPPRPRLHTVEHVASIFEWLGLPAAALGPARVYPPPHDRARMRRHLDDAGIAGGFVFFNTEPRSFTMRWEPERFAELAVFLRARYGWAAVAAGAGAPISGVTRLTDTTVADLIALLAEAAIVVGSDGGPLHVAAALGKPVVALFASTDSVVWAPWQTSARVVQNHFPCNPCRADRCYQFARPECILSITPAQVAAAVTDILPPTASPPQFTK